MPGISCLCPGCRNRGAGARRADHDLQTGECLYLNGLTFTVTRNQNMNATLQGEFARTSRACPLDCIQPMRIADGVATLGELELLDFLEDRVTGGTGLLLDTRVPAEFATGSIPGGVNVSVATLDPENRFRDDILRAWGSCTD
jgi:hypothetical protein